MVWRRILTAVLLASTPVAHADSATDQLTSILKSHLVTLDRDMITFHYEAPKACIAIYADTTLKDEDIKTGPCGTQLANSGE